MQESAKTARDEAKEKLKKEMQEAYDKLSADYVLLKQENKDIKEEAENKVKQEREDGLRKLAENRKFYQAQLEREVACL